jgi:hypothetical protein
MDKMEVIKGKAANIQLSSKITFRPIGTDYTCKLVLNGKNCIIQSNKPITIIENSDIVMAGESNKKGFKTFAYYNRASDKMRDAGYLKNILIGFWAALIGTVGVLWLTFGDRTIFHKQYVSPEIFQKPPMIEYLFPGIIILYGILCIINGIKIYKAVHLLKGNIDSTHS